MQNGCQFHIKFHEESKNDLRSYPMIAHATPECMFKKNIIKSNKAKGKLNLTKLICFIKTFTFKFCNNQIFRWPTKAAYSLSNFDFKQAVLIANLHVVFAKISFSCLRFCLT